MPDIVELSTAPNEEVMKSWYLLRLAGIAMKAVYIGKSDVGIAISQT